MWGTVHILRMGNWSWSMREETSAWTPMVQTTCQPLLLLNVTTRYALSTIITFECDHSMVCTVNHYYFWMWSQHIMHCHQLLLLNVTTARCALSTVITFECDHSTVRTFNLYYFWMWPQHGTHFQPLLLLNVTTARYALSTFITFECDHSTVRTFNRYYFWVWPQHGMHCIFVTLLLLFLTTELWIIIILNEFCVEFMSAYVSLCQLTCKFILSVFWVTSGTCVVKHLTLT